MKRNLAILFALIGWFAVIVQFAIMINNRVESIPETIIRFFSFFTILTNLLVAVYFSFYISENKRPVFLTRPGLLTAITVYIAMVGSVYQILLRHAWDPQGLQRVVDELLHTIIPVLVIFFWYLYEHKSSIRYTQAFTWLTYPMVYLAYILIRGHFSNFYPYPFIDVSRIGLEKALITAGILVLAFLSVSFIFIFLSRSILSRDSS